MIGTARHLFVIALCLVILQCSSVFLLLYYLICFWSNRISKFIFRNRFVSSCAPHILSIIISVIVVMCSLHTSLYSINYFGLSGLDKFVAWLLFLKLFFVCISKRILLHVVSQSASQPANQSCKFMNFALFKMQERVSVLCDYACP